MSPDELVQASQIILLDEIRSRNLSSVQVNSIIDSKWGYGRDVIEFIKSGKFSFFFVSDAFRALGLDTMLLKDVVNGF